MDNLPFALWMVGWPFVTIIESYLLKITDSAPPKEDMPVLAFIMIIIWVGVGFLLYRR